MDFLIDFPITLLISIAVGMYLLIYVDRHIKRSLTSNWMLIVLAASTSAQMGQLALHYISNPVIFEMVASWRETMNYIMIPMAMLMFALGFVGFERAYNHWFVYGPLSLWCISYNFLLLHTDLVLDISYDRAQHGFWLYSFPHGPLLPIFQLALLAALAASVILFMYKRSRVHAVEQRKQLTWLSLSIAFAVLLGFAIGDKTDASLTTAVSNAFILYAVVRYGFLSTGTTAISSQVVKVMPAAILGINKTGSIMYANPHAQRVLGKYGDILSLHASDFFQTEREYIRFSQYCLSPVFSGKDVRGYGAVFNKNVDQPIHFSINCTAETDKQNNVMAAVLVLSDVSALKEAETQLQRAKRGVEKEVVERTRELQEQRATLKASIDSLSLGFTMVSPDRQRVLITNDAMRRIFKMRPGWTIGQLDGLLPSLDLDAKIQEVLARQRPTTVQELDFSGKVVRILLAPVALADTKQPLGVVMLAEDITEAKVLDRSKDEFFSIASHELRTPLTAIKGNTSMLLQYYDEVLKQHVDMREMVVDVHDSSARLIDIVNDFLDVSRLEQGKLKLDLGPVAIDEVVERIAYEMGVTLKAKDIQLKMKPRTLGTLPMVVADKNRLQQVLYNLVGNAAKFTSQGSITIECTAGGKMMEVSVTDTGAGIPAENQKLLFHKFQQAGSSILTRDTTRGTGLGLYISKLLVTGMGGRLILKQSTPGKGSCFAFTLPIAQVPPPKS